LCALPAHSYLIPLQFSWGVRLHPYYVVNPTLLSRSVRDNALGSIIGGIVLAVLAAAAGKLTGWLPQVWDTGRRAVRSLWALLVGEYSLTLRGWIWAVGWVALILTARSVLRHWAAETAAETPAAPEWPSLEELEHSVMHALAQMDGQSVFLSDLAMRLRVSQLRLGKALENLEAIAFIEPEHNVLYGTKAGLTRRGRDYILAKGLGT
jgi:hypothetical protein